MLESDRIALHYDVVASTAHKIEKVSKELAELYRASYINLDRIKLKEHHLQDYINELSLYTKD